MNLSHRVWNLKEQYKQELEMGLSVGIEKGTSAASLAKQMKQYLNEPDKLFRRVRDKFGNLELSKNAKAYHPGRGIYRSSYKNAMRLTRSETNMAYRTAEQTRWQQFDFVVGYEIHTTQNGMHKEDVCDDLAGKYPKDFVWTGWHPMCMCYCVSILKTEDEFWRDLGKEEPEKSENQVDDVPEKFKEWVEENKERIENANERGTTPYFIEDNKEYVNDILTRSERVNESESNDELKVVKKTPQEIAEIQNLTNSVNNTTVQSEHRLNMFDCIDDIYGIEDPDSDIQDSKRIEFLIANRTDIVMQETGCTRSEAENYIKSIFGYSKGWDTEIRRYQCGDSSPAFKPGHTSIDVENKAKSIEEFIRRSPKWDGGETYRGMTVKSDVFELFKSSFENNTSIDMRGSSSWSTRYEIAENYSYRNFDNWLEDHRIIFRCKGRQNGTSILHISNVPQEAEILCSKKSKWKIIGMTKLNDYSSEWIFDVELIN